MLRLICLKVGSCPDGRTTGIYPQPRPNLRREYLSPGPYRTTSMSPVPWREGVSPGGTGRIRQGLPQGFLKHPLSPKLRPSIAPNLVCLKAEFYLRRSARCSKACPPVRHRRRMGRARHCLVPSEVLWIRVRTRITVRTQRWRRYLRRISAFPRPPRAICWDPGWPWIAPSR